MTYRARGSSPVESIDISGTTELSKTIINLKPYTRYDIQVAAKTIGCGVQATTSYVTPEDGKDQKNKNISNKYVL